MKQIVCVYACSYGGMYICVLHTQLCAIAFLSWGQCHTSFLRNCLCYVFKTWDFPKGSRTLWENPQQTLSWAHRVSHSLNWQPQSLHGTDLGALHICYSCIVWSSCGNPSCGILGCLWLFCKLLKSSSSYWVPLVILSTMEGA